MLKMARSVHSYVRGNTAKFYEWLADAPLATTIPQGPPIWICGDCHLGNMGPVGDADEKVDFQIRDLDQTVVGNPALDLVRLALSLETAARSSDLPGVATVNMLGAMGAAYRAALDADPRCKLPEPDVVRTARRRALKRRWRHLAEERIGDMDPTIPLGKRFWPIDEAERAAIVALFEQRAVRRRAMELAGLGPEGGLRLLDAAYWKKGCSSLGHLRFAVLLGVSDEGRGEHLALVDIKEAVPPLAPAARRAKMPRDDARRVVAGACALAPNLGERMIAAHLLSRPVVLRELKPQDLKLEVEQFSRKEAVRAAAYLAYVVGRAHARQLDEAGRQSWLECLSGGGEDDRAPPGWLWNSVVDLAAMHERAYLDHCRTYALDG
ncbi:MAG: DUF2252 family protein [Alphaproteobacteria bacterium]|nr:DUF2252 family protein [Alphaproteobacteria bacterium]